MRSIAKAAAIGLSIVAASLALTGNPASAGQVQPTTSTLLLTISTPITAGSTSGGVAVSAWLTCDPAGGDHPTPLNACADLAAAGGDVAAVPPLKGWGCVGLWDPVQISAVGTWRGQPVNFKAMVSNSGCARISHGYVFMLKS